MRATCATARTLGSERGERGETELLQPPPIKVNLHQADLKPFIPLLNLPSCDLENQPQEQRQSKNQLSPDVFIEEIEETDGRPSKEVGKPKTRVSSGIQRNILNLNNRVSVNQPTVPQDPQQINRESEGSQMKQ